METLPPFAGLLVLGPGFLEGSAVREGEGGERGGAGRMLSEDVESAGSWPLPDTREPWSVGTSLFVPCVSHSVAVGCLPRGGVGLAWSVATRKGRFGDGQPCASVPCQPRGSWGTDALSGEGRLGGAPTTG